MLFQICALLSFTLAKAVVHKTAYNNKIIIILGTWGSHSRTIRKPASGSAPSSGKSTPLPQQLESASNSTSSNKGSKKFTGNRSGSTSRSNSAERRRSGSDETASPTRKSALFDAFRPRSKSDASKTRKPSIIANMKNVMQVRLVFKNILVI